MPKPKEGMRFEELARTVNRYLKDEGLELNLSGYRQTMHDFFQLVEHETAKVHRLMIECSMWAHYFSEIESLLLYYKEFYLIEEDYYKAHEVEGNPFPALEASILVAGEKKKHVEQFRKQCRAQKSFFEKSSQHCYRIYQRTAGQMSRHA